MKKTRKKEKVRKRKGEELRAHIRKGVKEHVIKRSQEEKKVRITCTYKKRSKRTRNKEKLGREKGKNYVRK